ncbi:MAG: hypothetical protein ACXVYY_08735 [Oryzihumus sp.]
MRVRAVTALAVVMVLAACTGQPPPLSDRATRAALGASAPSSPSTSSTPSPTMTSLEQEAPWATNEVMLSESRMRKAGFRMVQQRLYSTPRGWFVQCGPAPAMNERAVGVTSEKWYLKSAALVGQSAVAYQPPGATNAMRLIKRRYKACSTFTDGVVTYRHISTLALPKVQGIDDQVAWCQDADKHAACAAEFRRGDMIIERWATSWDRTASRVLLQDAARALQDQLHAGRPKTT